MKMNRMLQNASNDKTPGYADFKDLALQALEMSVEDYLESLNRRLTLSRHRRTDLALGKGLSCIACSGSSFLARF